MKVQEPKSQALCQYRTCKTNPKPDGLHHDQHHKRRTENNRGGRRGDTVWGERGNLDWEEGERPQEGGRMRTDTTEWPPIQKGGVGKQGKDAKTEKKLGSRRVIK